MLHCIHFHFVMNSLFRLLVAFSYSCLESELLILYSLMKWLFLCLFFLLHIFTLFWFLVTGTNNVYSSVVGWMFSLTFFVWSFEVEVCYLCAVDSLIVLMFVLLLFVIFSVSVLCLRILFWLLVLQKTFSKSKTDADSLPTLCLLSSSWFLSLIILSLFLYCLFYSV